jgi:hypothetical protein
VIVVSLWATAALESDLDGLYNGELALQLIWQVGLEVFERARTVYSSGRGGERKKKPGPAVSEAEEGGGTGVLWRQETQYSSDDQLGGLRLCQGTIGRLGRR